MNAIQNARAPASQSVPAAEANARNRQGAPEAGADSFEQMLSPRPATPPADGDAGVLPPPPDGAFSGVSTMTLPQALADLLREALKPTPDDGDDDALSDENATTAPLQAPTGASPLPTFTAASATPVSSDEAPARAPQLGAPQVSVDDAPESGDAEGDGAAARSAPDTGATRTERSSIMSTLDEALQAPRHAATREGGDTTDGSAQRKQDASLDGLDAAFSADEGVKVSFVSMSRSPAPVLAVSEAAPIERPQAAAPPTPPPPATAAAQHLRLVMEPSGLGAVALNLSLSDARVSVDLEAQRSETRHKLEAGRDQLVDSLTGAGYDVAHVQVKTASIEAGFDPARREGAATNDAPSERAQQERDQGSRGEDHEASKGDHADDPRTRPHRSGGVFI